MRAFDVEANPSRPMRPSPLTASNIRDMPLDLFDRIRTFPMFASAPDDFLAAILSHLRPQVHAVNDHIVTEGDDAKAMYWLVRGVVAVTSRDGEAVYAELKSGAFFGEIGVLMNVPRTATIVARTKCLLVVLMKDQLLAELPKYPEMEQAILQEAQERLSVLQKKRGQTLNLSSTPSSPPPPPLQTPPTAALRLPGAKQPRRDHGPGDAVVGEVGTIADGLVVPDTRTPPSPSTKITPPTTSTSTSTMNNINTRKRKSPSPGIIEDAVTGGSVLGSGLVNIRKTLKELPTFARLPPDILHFLGLSAQPKTYPPFTSIVRQGSPGNDIFFIVRGEAEVMHDGLPDGALPRLRQGQYFGEVASLGLSPGRTATVRSITTVECLMIGGEALDELWRRCPPEVRSEVERTARQRYRKYDGDIIMTGADAEVSPPQTPKDDAALPRLSTLR